MSVYSPLVLSQSSNFLKFILKNIKNLIAYRNLNFLQNPLVGPGFVLGLIKDKGGNSKEVSFSWYVATH